MSPQRTSGEPHLRMPGEPNVRISGELHLRMPGEPNVRISGELNPPPPRGVLPRLLNYEDAHMPEITTGRQQETYDEVQQRIAALLEGETDWIAAMATVASELHHSFDHFHWTGFYRAVSDELLVIGPYQGGHGCLRIPYSRGVCGAAARTRETQLVPDVNKFPGHIACSSTTRSEIVVPVITPSGTLLAVLDVDSNDPAAFDSVDRACLEQLCRRLGEQFGAAV